MNKTGITLNVLEKYNIGGTKQWVLLRGSNYLNPVLLLIQAGPGFPIIHEANEIERLLELEKHFTVVYWDQRGCGKSFSSKLVPQSMNLNQLVSDTHELIEKIKLRLNVKKIYAAGFSLGGSIAIITASKYPENFYAVIGAGIDIKNDEAEKITYSFVMQRAIDTGNKKAIKELTKIGAPPHLDQNKFSTRVKWVTNFGGINRNETYNSLLKKTLRNMFSSKEYSLTDIIRTIKGMNFSQTHLLKDLVKLNMFEMVPSVQIPIYLLQGKHDYAADPALTEQYFEKLSAPNGKQLIWFNNSAHMPHYEEPEKFKDVLINKILLKTYK